MSLDTKKRSKKNQDYVFSSALFLDKKVPKSQDSACFAQKTSVQKAKTPKLAALRLKQWVFFNAFFSCFLAHQSRSVLALFNIPQNIFVSINNP